MRSWLPGTCCCRVRWTTSLTQTRYRRAASPLQWTAARRRCCYHRPTTCSARSTNHQFRFHWRSHHFFTHRRTPEGRCNAPGSPAHSVSPIARLQREGAMLLDLRHTRWPVAGPHSFLHPSPDSRGKVRCSRIFGTLGSQWLGFIPFFTHRRTPEGRCDAPGSPALSVASGWASFLSSAIAGLSREGGMLLDLQHSVASGWASFLSSPIAGLPREGAMLLDLRHNQ